MSQPTVPGHTSRLASLVNRPGGLTEDEAVSAATANLEGMRERTLIEIDATLQRMQAIGAALAAEPDPAALDALYGSSHTLIGVAGTFGLGGLSAVAYSLCELIDRMRTSRTWNPLAVRVHLDSLRLMQVAGPGERDGWQVRDALRAMVERVPTTPE